MKSIPEQAKGNIPRRNVFEAHFGQTQARPLNEAPSRRTPSRRGGGFLAKYRPNAFPKESRTGKTPFRGKISPPCIQNELILARYAPHVFKMPYKAPLEDTSGEHLAIKAPFCRPNPLNHAWRATLAMHDGFHRTNLATLDGSRWTNPATLDGFTGRIRPCMMTPLGESYRAQWFLSCKSCHPALAAPVGQSTLDGANGFHRRVRHCHFRECPLKNT